MSQQPVGTSLGASSSEGFQFDLEQVGAGLPVLAQAKQWAEAICQHQTLVIQAPPGTGKTTLAPAVVANQVAGKTIVVAPRRVAVRAAARRLRYLSGSEASRKSASKNGKVAEAPGHNLIGLSVRGQHEPGERVEFVTPGVLLQRLLRDPSLEGIDAVVIDEIHERHVDTDLILGMLVELRQLRPELVLVAMSATVDAQRFAALIGSAEHQDADAGNLPETTGDAAHSAAPIVATDAPIHPLEVIYEPVAGRFPTTGEFLQQVARIALQEFHASEHSILVFVPGVREVEKVCEFIGPDARPLHGRLSASEQDAALIGGKRIVVATAIAESSLTVPGVRVVVDAGLSRTPKRDAARGVQGLVTVSATKAAAVQRAGRAGREGPGKVVRCYREAEFQRFQAHVPPEITAADLTFAALALSCWGTPYGAGFPLLTPPPQVALEQAYATLTHLGAVDEQGLATSFGMRLAELPVDPRQGAALLRCGKAAAATVAQLAEQARGDLRVAPYFPAQQRRLERLAGPGDLNLENTPTPDEWPGVAVGCAYPEFIARNVDGTTYLLAAGSQVEISFSKGEPWFAVGEVTRTAGGKLRAANGAPISQKAAQEIIGVREENRAWVENGQVKALRVKAVGEIVLSETPVRLSKQEIAEALLSHLRAHPDEAPAPLTYEPEAENLAQRLTFLANTLGAPWQDPRTQDPKWLLPELQAIANGEKPTQVPLLPAIKRCLPWPEAAQLEELAPAALAVPSGRKVPIDYSGEQPTVHVKLQECFGLVDSPKVCGVPILFHLLSPAGRPLAVTADLASFWAGPYQGVRAEMRGRYPKHPWPEDPLEAQATAGTNRRR